MPGHLPIYKEPMTCICIYCLDHRIKKLENKSMDNHGWKNSRIEKPTQDNIVLVYTSDKLYHIATYFKEENVFRLNNYAYKVMEVTHWMYLPPTPKN